MKQLYRGRQPVRSADLSAEEIDRERAGSGWNPYEGEEEPPEEPRMTALPGRRRPTRAGEPAGAGRGAQPAGDPVRPGWTEQEGSGQTGSGRTHWPIYEQKDALDGVRELERAEKDRRRLQAMYPEAAREALPYIEEECDKLEYEGSPLFDAVPDRETVWRLCREIRRKLAEQGRESKGNQPDQRWTEDLVRVLLLEEMHQRRRRHSRFGDR